MDLRVFSEKAPKKFFFLMTRKEEINFGEGNERILTAKSGRGQGQGWSAFCLHASDMTRGDFLSFLFTIQSVFFTLQGRQGGEERVHGYYHVWEVLFLFFVLFLGKGGKEEGGKDGFVLFLDNGWGWDLPHITIDQYFNIQY